MSHGSVESSEEIKVLEAKTTERRLDYVTHFV